MSHNQSNDSAPPKALPSLDWMQFIIYSGRYALHPVYAAMLVVLGLYCVTFVFDLIHFVQSFFANDEDQKVVAVLQFVDHSMIANLIYLIMVGGYDIFLKKFRFKYVQDKPKWLEHIDSYSLKVKMGGSLIGVTTVHLLTSFFDAKSLTWDLLGKQLIIHFTFIVSTYYLMKIGERTHRLHMEIESFDAEEERKAEAAKHARLSKPSAAHETPPAHDVSPATADGAQAAEHN